MRVLGRGGRDAYCPPIRYFSSLNHCIMAGEYYDQKGAKLTASPPDHEAIPG
jgi:hypothetical protein